MGKAVDKAGAARMRRVVGRYRASGLSQRQFSEREGINVWTLRNWLRRSGGQARRAAPKGQARFVQAQLVPTAVPAAAGLEYVFSDGSVLRFGPGVALGDAVAAVRALRGQA
jgi:hypothetical protein